MVLTFSNIDPTVKADVVPASASGTLSSSLCDGLVMGPDDPTDGVVRVSREGIGAPLHDIGGEPAHAVHALVGRIIGYGHRTDMTRDSASMVAPARAKFRSPWIGPTVDTACDLLPLQL